MLTLPPSVRIFVALGATDMRRGMDGLAVLVREQLGFEPLSGHLFLFRNPSSATSPPALRHPDTTTARLRRGGRSCAHDNR
jgi:transposase